MPQNTPSSTRAVATDTSQSSKMQAQRVQSQAAPAAKGPKIVAAAAAATDPEATGDCCACCAQQLCHPAMQGAHAKKVYGAWKGREKRPGGKHTAHDDAYTERGGTSCWVSESGIRVAVGGKEIGY